MTRIQNILVGVDLHHGDRIASPKLGDESQTAVTEALQLAATWGGTITFCSVLEISAQSQSLIEHDHENILKTVEDVASSILTTLVNHSNAQGIPAESVVRFGAAWEELSKESANGPYDLVIIGTRSKHHPTSLLFGNTAQKLMRYAACPVWVVKPSELRDIRDVAVASDLSPASLPAMKVAVTVARAIGARLHVLHVLELADLRYLALAGVTKEKLGKTEEKLRQSADEKLRDQLHRTDFRTLPHGVKIEYLSGSPDSVIPEFVKTNSIDLLVMGTNGHSRISEFFLGNTAERILPTVHASLLTVKPDGFKSPYEK
jgi:universal stress protein E